MANPYSVRHSWIVKSAATDGTSTQDLLPFQFGIVNPKTWKTVSSGSFQSLNEVIFALGSPHTGQEGNEAWSFPNNASRNISFKTAKINGRNITGFRTAHPQKVVKPYQMIIGYDGLNPCKNLAFECGKTYGMHIQVYGTPVGLTFPDKFVQEIIDITTPCCDDCSTDCVSENLCSTVIDEIVAKINKAHWISHFIHADKIQDCCPVESPVEKIEYEVYQLTLCDTGDAIALANVQNAYPTLKVKRVSRNGVLSTYEVCVAAGVGSENAPDTFSYTPITSLDCAECANDADTLVPAYDIWYVSTSAAVASSNAMETALGLAGDTIPDIGGVTLVSNQNGRFTYVVYVPVGTEQGTLAAATTTVIETGTQTVGYCEAAAPVETEWTMVDDSVYKVTRTMTIQLEIPECNGTREADTTSLLKKFLVLSHLM